jgi:hypothetical protein
VKLWNLNPDLLTALGCYWSKDYFITHSKVKKELTICDHFNVLKNLPQLLVIQAKKLVKIGGLDRAKEMLADGEKLDDKINIEKILSEMKNK